MNYIMPEELGQVRCVLGVFNDSNYHHNLENFDGGFLDVHAPV